MKESDDRICPEMMIGRNKKRDSTGGNRENREEKKDAATFRENLKFDEGNHKSCY